MQRNSLYICVLPLEGQTTRLATIQCPPAGLVGIYCLAQGHFSKIDTSYIYMEVHIYEGLNQHPQISTLPRNKCCVMIM